MAVEVCEQRWVRVTEPLGRNLRRHTTSRHEGGAGVPKTMRSEPRKIQLLGIRGEHAGRELGMVLTTGDFREDQFALAPFGGSQPLSILDGFCWCNTRTRLSSSSTVRMHLDSCPTTAPIHSRVSRRSRPLWRGDGGGPRCPSEVTRPRKSEALSQEGGFKEGQVRSPSVTPRTLEPPLDSSDAGSSVVPSASAWAPWDSMRSSRNSRRVCTLLQNLALPR
jgi:hypothetical protein